MSNWPDDPPYEGCGISVLRYGEVSMEPAGYLPVGEYFVVAIRDGERHYLPKVATLEKV